MLILAMLISVAPSSAISSSLSAFVRRLSSATDLSLPEIQENCTDWNCALILVRMIFLSLSGYRRCAARLQKVQIDFSGHRLVPNLFNPPNDERSELARQVFVVYLGENLVEFLLFVGCVLSGHFED